jgi:hypothetical protein
MELLKYIFWKKHVCVFFNPLASRYVSFNCRDIAYSCTCGKKTIKRVHAYQDQAFPIETNMLMSTKELENIAKN